MSRSVRFNALPPSTKNTKVVSNFDRGRCIMVLHPGCDARAVALLVCNERTRVERSRFTAEIARAHAIIAAHTFVAAARRGSRHMTRCVECTDEVTEVSLLNEYIECVACALDRRSSTAYEAQLNSLVHRVRHRARTPRGADAHPRRSYQAQPRLPSELFPASLASFRRRSRRTPDLRLHARSRRCRAQQQLDGAGRSTSPCGWPVRRFDARAHDVHRPLLHGPDRIALFSLRRRDYR